MKLLCVNYYSNRFILPYSSHAVQRPLTAVKSLLMCTPIPHHMVQTKTLPCRPYAAPPSSCTHSHPTCLGFGPATPGMEVMKEIDPHYYPHYDDCILKGEGVGFTAAP